MCQNWMTERQLDLLHSVSFGFRHSVDHGCFSDQLQNSQENT